MAQRIRINDGLSVDMGQPTREALGRLAQEGFRAVVNLRMAGEQDQPLSPQAEGEVVRQAGLAYVHISVAGAGWKPEQVNGFREELSKLPGPVLVHCASGKRSGAFAMLHVASQEKLTGEDTLVQAKKLGFDWVGPEPEGFIKRYMTTVGANRL